MSLMPDDVQLFLGGVGPLTQDLQQQAEALGIARRVHFLGKILETELPAYYQACDLFCLPSVTQAEAFGIVQVEAMAAGKPVVNTNLGNGVNFVTQDGVTGLTVPPNNSRALAAALQILLQNPTQRLQLGANGRARAESEFSLETMKDRTYALYAELKNGTCTRSFNAPR
jgi:rhamnosyl/mannosyltransferase